MKIKRLCGWLALLMVLLIAEPSYAANVKQLERSLNQAVSAKNWVNAAIYSSRLAEYYEERQEYDKAVTYYDRSATYYEYANWPSFVVDRTNRANQIRTEVDLYVEKPLPRHQTLAKFEPHGGTYLGLFLAGKRENANPDVVEDIYGRNHALYLTYSHWRRGYSDTNSYFPLKFAENAKRNGSAIQVAWEPSYGLDDVKDDEYVRQFAREAKQAGIPIFLRFAGEMNGEWVPWHDKPEKYIEKFRLIHDIMEEEAPNVAMVWSPNFLPRHNIDQYYPGDKYVDWVGLSLYTIPYSHGREVPGGNPIDYLKPIYEKYKHKPIMISEGAVSHVSYELGKDYSQWAAGQIGNMYGFLPKMFPQVKAITYFNLDKKTTNYDNQNNNYDLGDSPIVDQAYQRMIRHQDFIDQLSLENPNPGTGLEYVPIKDLKEASGKHRAFVYVKLPQGVQPYYVAVYQGQTKLGESYAQPWEMTLDFSKIDPKRELTLIAFDKNFKRLATKHVKPSFKHVSKLGSFTDVSASHWAFDAIEQAESEGIVKGYPNGQFRPDQKVKVHEFMAILARAYGKGAELEQAPYPQGVTDFMEKMNFPLSETGEAMITRQEAAEIISATQGQNLTGDDAIKYLLVNGLSNGRNPKRISVKDYEGSATLTRAEAVTFIAHIRKNGVDELQARPEEPTDPSIVREQYEQRFGNS